MAPKARDGGSGLGRAIINRKVKDARIAQESGLFTTDIDSTTKLKSVTQERDLDEFLNTAQLAETDFTAERRNVKIIPQAADVSKNPYLLSEEEEKSTLLKHSENRNRLAVPRRPPWTKKMSHAELERQEKAAFLDWRRGLAQLQEQEQFLLTPFERNLEVWRQLWRVLERSQLVVQIVDARNPLRFRCEDLEAYVKVVEGPDGEYGSITGHGEHYGRRRNLLLINKADLLTAKQRSQWADYFASQNIQYAFFSAANAAALQQARREGSGASGSNEEEEEEDEEEEEEEASETDSTDDEDEDEYVSAEEDSGSADVEDEASAPDPRAHILSVLELEDLFTRMAPDLDGFYGSDSQEPKKLIVGLVGYPNVGKSSTINSLLGEKKVSVSSTPGKTKHFQTIHLTETVVLCDCPGLVFPQFATTKADLVCDGVLPIDQMREYSGPSALLAKRIPKDILEATYGIIIQSQNDNPNDINAYSLLQAYAIARGFMRSGQGNPDEARAARYILKDYVNAKLLYCHPPPNISADVFNQETYKIALKRLISKKHAPSTRVPKNSDTFIEQPRPAEDQHSAPPVASSKLQSLDDEFFDNSAAKTKGPDAGRMRIFPHQNTVADDGTQLTGRRARMAAVLANAERAGLGSGKKGHKKPKRVKQRSGKGYD